MMHYNKLIYFCYEIDTIFSQIQWMHLLIIYYTLLFKTIIK